MTKPIHNLGAVVLCGGRSVRMERAKALLEMDGRSLIGRVVDVVGAAADPVVVCAAGGQALPGLPAGVRVVRDSMADGGPLAAVADGLDALNAHVDVAFVCACDMPFVSAELVAVLHAALVDADGAVPLIGEQRHPLAGVYRVDVAARARELLSTGRRSMHALLDALDIRWVDQAALADGGVNPDALCNVNTPADWERVVRQTP